MANVTMERLELGREYTAVQLAQMWGYKSHHPLVRGMVTPTDTNIIILFVTKKKQTGATQYEDEIKENILYMMGQKKHGSDKRLLSNLEEKKDSIYLFYRELHHTPFIYFGDCILIDAKINEHSPSEFKFLIENSREDMTDESGIIDYIVNVETGNGKEIPLLIEGAKLISQHVRYERNTRNRKEAIRKQGHKCKICGFDFNEVYGEELADGYIEVHHIKPLAQGLQAIDPAKDLITVCANCHRMLHRKKHSKLLPQTLMDLIRKKA